MRIIITGARGFVGQLLVPQLIASGAELCLVGRSAEKLRSIFPNMECCNYGQLKEQSTEADLFIHLAAVNSDSKLPEGDFFSTNVDFMMHVAETANSIGVKKFVNVSSIHALDDNKLTYYARSKRAAAIALRDKFGDWGQTVYLPPVYSDQWSGNLSILNYLPTAIAKLVFVPISALKPVVHISRLSNFLLNLPVVSPRESSLILVDDKTANRVYTWTKRSIDLCAALLILVLAGWLMGIIWLVVLCTSPGPGLFIQDRVGRCGRVFSCYKFRTMQNNTEQRGTHEVSPSSVTKVGSILRRTKLDELPQVINILKNEMSLIGPRPCLPSQIELIEERSAQNVYNMKPGVSGLAQINGIDMSTPRLLADWDARYCKLRSLSIDLSIMISTVAGRGQGDKIKITSGRL